MGSPPDASPDASTDASTGTPPEPLGGRPTRAGSTDHAGFATASPEGAVPARVALCLHSAGPNLHEGAPHSDLPHIDLFVGPSGTAAGSDGDARIARSWRLPAAARDWRAALHTAGVIRWPATPTPAHRALYLRLAHPRTLDGGRGIVEPLAAGDGWMLSRPGDVVAEVRLVPLGGEAHAIAVRIEVRDDAGGAIAEFRVVEPREGAMHER